MIILSGLAVRVMRKEGTPNSAGARRAKMGAILPMIRNSDLVQCCLVLFGYGLFCVLFDTLMHCKYLLHYNYLHCILY